MESKRFILFLHDLLKGLCFFSGILLLVTSFVWVGPAVWKIAHLAGATNETAINIALFTWIMYVFILNIIPGMGDKDGKEYFP